MIRSSVNYRLPESLLRKPRVNLRVSSGQKAYLIYFKPRKLIRPCNTSTDHVCSNIFFVFFFFLLRFITKAVTKNLENLQFCFFFFFFLFTLVDINFNSTVFKLQADRNCFLELFLRDTIIYN